MSQTTTMPVVFIGHGSPMLAIQDTDLTRSWEEIAQQIGKPKAILSISAHWYTETTAVQSSLKPQQIYDMYNFPEELYAKTYPVHGNAQLSQQVQELLKEHNIQVDNTWGIDHGSWAILTHMYPEADIPVVQLSVNSKLSPAQQYELGQKLQSLREQGILIFASGNIVHNLSLISRDGSNPDLAWAKEFDNWMRDQVVARNLEQLLAYKDHPHAELAAPTTDHVEPLFYVLGATSEKDQVKVFNDDILGGALSYTSFIWR